MNYRHTLYVRFHKLQQEDLGMEEYIKQFFNISMRTGIYEMTRL